MLMIENVKSFTEGGSYYVVGIFIWCVLFFYTVFPDNVIFRTVTKWTYKIFFRGVRQKW